MTQLFATENGFCIQGAVGFANVIHLRFQGEKLLKKLSASKEIVIDLSEMKEQDASPFSLLLCFERLARKNKMTVRLTHMPLSMQRMQKMFGLSWTN